jgi:hypothetical protein
MLSSANFAAELDTIAAPFSTGVHRRRLPADEADEVAPQSLESLILEEWLPQRRDHERRLQQTIDAVDHQLALLDERGTIVAVNRAWRLTADVQGLNDLRHGVGRNYLSLCRSAAADGCCDAALVAEGLAGVLSAQWRSFHYKYDWHAPHERRTYTLLARRIIEDGITYTAVSHELIETHVK